MIDKIPMMIAVRGYAVPVREEESQKASPDGKKKWKKRKALPSPSKWTVCFDTETTVDYAQNLRIGTYQVRDDLKLHEKGIFFEPANLTSKEILLLKNYVRKYSLILRTREEFVREILYPYGYDRGGLILGFNLPFDLSRLAISISTSHGKDMRGGFSLELLGVKWRCNPLVKHLNSRASFMRFASPPRQVDGRGMRKKGFKTQPKRGYFQDIKTLAASFLGRSFTLASLAKLLQTEHQKMDTGEHGGPLTTQYLDYAVNDTDVTWECYVKLLELYKAHGLIQTSPHRIYSEASLGKAYLKEMGVQPWTKLQPDFPPEILGIIMSTYFGGRAEIRIRRQMTRILYCDFRSMYPTVCTLMGLWQFVIATGVNYEDSIEEVRGLLKGIGLDEVKKPDFWKSLTTLVQIVPSDDILPVRSFYADGSRTIGLNNLSASFGCWFTLADCIASKLLTGKAPEIIKAIRFSPKEPQDALCPISIGGNRDFTIDPIKVDFYKRVIELRGQIQAREAIARSKGNINEAERLNAYQKMLKLLANSTSYGIFAEMNVQSSNRPKQTICYGAETTPFERGTSSTEEPGSHFHPLLATLITGAARLMLAVGERVAADNGLGWALCDTDSLALARPADMNDSEFLKRAETVTCWFDALNPYDDEKAKKALFKVEEQNFTLENGKVQKGVHEPLYTIAISAKRYVLFNLDENNKPVIRKVLAHGLGQWLEPYDDAHAPAFIPAPVVDLGESGVRRWQYDLWYQIIVAELEGHSDQVDLSRHPQLDRPAASRYSAASAPLLRWFAKFNEGKDFSEQVKAFNFLLAYQVSPTAMAAAIANGDIAPDYFNHRPAVVAPFDSDAVQGASKCFDRLTGKPVPSSILATYCDVLSQYHLHSEAKFDNGDWTDRGTTERRHIEAIAIEYIGKEANRLEDQFFLGAMPEAQIEYGYGSERRERIIKMMARAAQSFGKVALADEAHLSRQQLAAILSGESSPRTKTIRSIMKAIVVLEAERHEKRDHEARLIDKVSAEVNGMGLAKVAQMLNYDPSNLKKVINRTRKMSPELEQRISDFCTKTFDQKNA